VVRLSGHRRTPDDLLHDLFAAVYNAPLHRPEREELLALVHEIGAVVVLDDVEFGAGALDELLDATPECAFLISATPDVPAPSADSLLEEVFLGGLGRGGGLELLERAVGRVLTEDEANWAGDLWFESEGLPLRFVQAGALLRQRDQLRADPNAFDEFGYYEDAPVDAPFDAQDGHDVPLPSLAEGAAPAALLATRLSESARATLRFAVALGGEVPHQAHLPALVGDTHADAALAELVGCALVTPVGSHYRLAAGVQTQLEAVGYASDAEEQARSAAEHYAWWAGHPSVTPERVVRRGGRRARRADRPGAGTDTATGRGRGERHRRTAGAHGRARVRRGAALERLGACAALRRRGGPAVRRGLGSGLFPPRAGHPRGLRRAVRPGPLRTGGLHRAARRPRREARHRRRPPRPRPGRGPHRHHTTGRDRLRRRARRCPTRGTRSRRRRPAAYRPDSLPAAPAARRARDGRQPHRSASRGEAGPRQGPGQRHPAQPRRRRARARSSPPCSARW
jgi:hypothetical protein